MAHETYASNNGSLSYTCCNKTNQLDLFKQYYAFSRPAGYGQIFSSIKNDVRFPLSIVNDEHHGCTITDRLYPVVIVCKAINTEIIK